MASERQTHHEDRAYVGFIGEKKGNGGGEGREGRKGERKGAWSALSWEETGKVREKERKIETERGRRRERRGGRGKSRWSFTF